MLVEIDKIFSATAQSPWQFLITQGQGCYIPAYQRPYTWDKDNVDRLLDDALNGIDQMLSRSNTISFLGTIIAIHDTRYRTIKPIYRPHVPPRVMTIIDGQQRISTFAMINIALHDTLRRQVKQLERRQGEEAAAWLLDQCETLLADLTATFQIDMTTGEGLLRYYPRITRAYDDLWSKRRSEAKYTSPIARLIAEYIAHLAKPGVESFRYQARDNEGQVIDSHRSVTDVFGHLQREIANIGGRKSEQYDFPSLTRIASKAPFCEGIWGYELPDSVKRYINEGSGQKGYAEFAAAMRTIILAKYMNNRMALTIVTTESEDDAFDMFEALNTTGEPLSAIETFKPRVIDEEGLERFETSPSREYFNRVDTYLDMFRKAEARQRATSELLIPFRLSEVGTRLPKRLNEQRRFLRGEYDGLESLDEKRDLVQSLGHLADFMRSAWNTEGRRPDFLGLNVVDEEALVCFQALRDLKHNIVIAPLSRFYDQARRAAPEEAAHHAQTFGEAIKATAAFSMLWRGASGGTDNIDAIYRDIMKVGVKYKGSDGSLVVIPPLAKRPEGDVTGVLSLNNYKHMLRHILTKEYPGQAAWVRNAARTSHERSRDVAKFLLFCAAHDASLDPEAPGLLVLGRPGLSPMLKLELWNALEFLSVEHIAPQHPDGKWDVDTSEDEDILHRLGNLTLLPREENSVLGNRSWEHKRLFYRMLCAETVEAQREIMAEAERSGLTLSIQATRVITTAKHLKLCEAVAAVPGNWDAEMIERRSRRLAELAWDRLYPWLEESV